MYFIFVYDHKYMKSDRDFFGDAIVSFHPLELKETYVFLLGQLIGTIEFAKTLTHSELNQIKLDKLVLTYKPLNDQFSLVLATSQTALANELTLKKKLVMVYTLIKTIHGPFQHLDRDENKLEYEELRTRVNELTLSCFNLVFKKRAHFNSYFSNITLDLQYKVESRCKHLVEYSMKKLRAFQGVLFYDDKILYTKTRDHMMLNIIYFLINEETDLLSRCDTVDISVDLPSGCQLVQINLSTALLSQIMMKRDGGSNNTSSESSYVELDEEDLIEESDLIVEPLPSPLALTSLESMMSEEAEVTMDMLPETTRFVTSEYLNANVASTDDEFLISSDSSRRITLYIQKNSRLKLVLLCMTSGSKQQQHQFKLDNIIRIWQNIVTNFSSLELGLLDENTTNNSETQSGGVVDLAVDESMEQSSNGAIGFRSNTICSCLVDRNRSIKYSKSSSRSSSTTSTQQTNSALLNQPAALLANMNLFYELVDSLPELSRMEVNKKGCTFSLLRQNMATVSTRTLESNVTPRRRGSRQVIGDFELVDKSPLVINNPSSSNRRTASVLSSNGFTSSSNTTKHHRASPDTLSTTSTTTSSSLSPAGGFNSPNSLLNYGDVVIKCDLGPIVS